MARARQRKEILFGYKLADADKAIINPPDKGVSRAWSFRDFFMSIAEDWKLIGLNYVL
jgi:hypothetical protein